MDSKRFNCLQVTWLGINVLLTYWLLSKLFTSSNVLNIPCIWRSSWFGKVI